jgi:hypothetical protein
VDSVPKKVRLGPPEFVTQLAQAFQAKKALRLSFDRQSIEPLQERARTVFFAV